MHMRKSDAALARKAANGNRKAFAALLERHYDRLFAFAFRITGSRVDAEDLTQDICAALPAKLGSFRGESRFSTWLYRVAINAAHDQRRRAETRAKAADGWGDWEVNRRASVSETRQALDWLAQTMKDLPGDLRDTVALTLGEELTQKDAAQLLGVSEGTIAWRMSMVRNLLRKKHEEETL